jgi:hypothetical protein
VEDRRTPGLYLELTDRPLDAYVTTRGPEVRALRGVERATWWRNVRRDREDLPRELPDVAHLALYEVDGSFVAPAPTDAIAAFHFRRTPRPGQGIITGRPTIGLSLVLISPRDPTRAQELRDWGDFVHIREIAAARVPGYTMITPYENTMGGDPRYLHCYEMDTDDPEAAFRSMTPLVERRIGARGTAAWNAWAFHPQLRIVYVNTFARVGGW